MERPNSDAMMSPFVFYFGLCAVCVAYVSHQFCGIELLMSHAELPAYQGTLALILNYLMPGKCQELPKH